MKEPTFQVVCPKCKTPMQTKSKSTTKCRKCHKVFYVPSQTKNKTPTLTPPAVATPPPAVASTVTKVSVQHTPVIKDTASPPPASEAEDQAEEKKGAQLSPEAIYHTFIKMPNDLVQLIFNKISKQLDLTPETEVAMKEWSVLFNEYCIKHGIYLPSFMELIPICMLPIGFWGNQARVIMQSEYFKKKTIPLPPPEVPEATVNPQNADKAQGADKKLMNALMNRPEQTLERSINL